MAKYFYVAEIGSLGTITERRNGIWQSSKISEKALQYLNEHLFSLHSKSKSNDVFITVFNKLED